MSNYRCSNCDKQKDGDISEITYIPEDEDTSIGVCNECVTEHFNKTCDRCGEVCDDNILISKEEDTEEYYVCKPCDKKMGWEEEDGK